MCSLDLFASLVVMPRKITHQVPPGSKPARLDVLLYEVGGLSSRSQAKRAIVSGMVKIDGLPERRPGTVVKSGAMLEAYIPDRKPEKPRPENIDLDFLYEDDDILVVDKPPGIIVHPGAGRMSGTLVNALLFHGKRLSRLGGDCRPGVVHRLDKETSGVLLVAKTDDAHRAMAAQFKNREVEKTYLALVSGSMDGEEGEIESAIGRHPVKRIRMKGHVEEGRYALTKWKVVERFPGATLLEVKPYTGRTHQIRVHLSEAGHPVVGDKMYSSQKRIKRIHNMKVRAALLGLKRHALHAHRLSFRHPASGEWLTLESPMPYDMRRAAEALRRAGAEI